MSGEAIALIMSGLLLLGLFMGHPLALVLGGTAVLGAFIAERPQVLGIVINRIFGDVLDNYVLIAIPLFVLMARFLSDSGVTDRMFEALRHLMSRVKGGLGLAVVFISILLAATTGIIGASITVMGVMALKPMLQYGYDKRLADGPHRRLGLPRHPDPALDHADPDGLLRAGPFGRPALRGGDGAGPAAGRDVCDLCRRHRLDQAGLGAPHRRGRPDQPRRHVEAAADRGAAAAGSDPRHPRLASGRHRHRDRGSAIGAVLALLIVIFRGRFRWATFYSALLETGRTSAMILFIVVGATAFTGVFNITGGLRAPART